MNSIKTCLQRQGTGLESVSAQMLGRTWDMPCSCQFGIGEAPKRLQLKFYWYLDC